MLDDQATSDQVLPDHVLPDQVDPVQAPPGQEPAFASSWASVPAAKGLTWPAPDFVPLLENVAYVSSG